MSFTTFLNESFEGNKKVDVDEYIKMIKSKGLFGYNVFKNIKEEDLKKIISNDSYFKEKMKSDDSSSDKDSNSNEEDKKKDLKESYIIEGAYSQSLADRLKLSNRQNKSNDSTSNDNGGKEESTPLRRTPLANAMQSSLADRLKAQRLQQQQDATKKRQQERLDLEKRLHQNDKPSPTFGNNSVDNQREQDQKNNTSLNSRLSNATINGGDKRSATATNEPQEKDKGSLKDRLFKRASTSTDDSGYKKVNNLKDVDDSSYEKKLQGSANRNAQQQKQRLPVNEYSKRTLCAIGDRMDNFNIYCKFRKKTDGQIRTGEFKILPTTSQITNKQDTIVVQDLDLSKKEKKVVYRSLNLSAIYEMKPL